MEVGEMSLFERSLTNYSKDNEGRTLDPATELDGNPDTGLVDELAWTLARIRYVRSVLAECRGDPERGEEVMEAIREVARD